MKILVEKNVPLPISPSATKRQEVNAIKTALYEMKFGDSFKVESASEAKRIRALAALMKKKLAIHMVEGGYRIWMQ